MMIFIEMHESLLHQAVQSSKRSKQLAGSSFHMENKQHLCQQMYIGARGKWTRYNFMKREVTTDC